MMEQHKNEDEHNPATKTESRMSSKIKLLTQARNLTSTHRLGACLGATLCVESIKGVGPDETKSGLSGLCLGLGAPSSGVDEDSTSGSDRAADARLDASLSEGPVGGEQEANF